MFKPLATHQPDTIAFDAIGTISHEEYNSAHPGAEATGIRQGALVSARRNRASESPACGGLITGK